MPVHLGEHERAARSATWQGYGRAGARGNQAGCDAVGGGETLATA